MSPEDVALLENACNDLASTYLVTYPDGTFNIKVNEVFHSVGIPFYDQYIVFPPTGVPLTTALIMLGVLSARAVL